MKTLRPYLSALLGLMFLAQGVAVAAAPHAAAPDLAAATADAEPPCHGAPDMGPDTDTGSSCCDGDCTQMSLCLLGHLAGATLPTLELPPPARIDARVRVVARVTPAPPFLLRPPIASHA